MPYTAETLATFMATELGATGTALFGDDPAAAPAVVEAVNEVAAVLGAAVADVSDDLKLRTVARWQVWLTAYGAAADQVDFKAGSADFKSSQWFKNIEARLARAETAAMRYSEVADALAGVGGTAFVSGVSTAGDPYAYPCSGSY
jgi:hypothetical protein